VKFIFDEVRKRLTDTLDAHIDSLSWARPETFERYAELCGTIKGLRISIQEVDDVEILVNKQEEQ
jgi:hypothetical protein